MLLRLAFCALAAAPPVASPARVPEAEQAVLFLKVLTADRNLPAHGADGLSVGVVFDGRSPASRGAAETFAAALGRPPKDVPRARVALLDVSAREPLAPRADAADVDAFWIAPVEAADRDRVVALARARKIRTAAALPADVAAGVAVGFEPGAGGARILVNLDAARAEGADFSAKLLKLARRVP